MQDGETFAKEGKIDEAIAQFEKAQKLDSNFKNYASLSWWNRLCWNGSLYRQAKKVMFACEKAVELAPENGGIRDSRGLARALTGDFDGAIQDFEAFVEGTNNEKYKEQRKGWIDSLKKGKNPFTDEVLEALRNQ